MAKLDGDLQGSGVTVSGQHQSLLQAGADFHRIHPQRAKRFYPAEYRNLLVVGKPGDAEKRHPCDKKKVRSPYFFSLES